MIGAYQYLLDWHLSYYNTHKDAAKKDKALTPTGALTTGIKKQILLNNIYGVDIDVNAVEVTKLSLLLKCMEGETSASISHQFQMFNERVLPTLDNNIKSGNSLVDTDFYDSQFDFGEEKKIKPFNWQKAFPEVFSPRLSKKVQVFKPDMDVNEIQTLEEPLIAYNEETKGGFDVVIGNPPYVMLQNLETREVFDYSLKKFQSAKYKIDTYQIFTEQSIRLLKEKGLLGFITPNTFLKNIHAEPLRKNILDTTTIKEILLFNYSVFAAASVDTCIFILEKVNASKKSELKVKTSDVAFEVKHISSINQFIFADNNRTDFNLLISSNDSELLNKILKNSKPLRDYCGAYFGIQTFDRSKYVSETKRNSHYEPVIDGGNIEPFKLKPPKEYVYYNPSAIKSGGSELIYRQDRICIRQIGVTPVATLVQANIFTLNTIYNVYLKEKNLADLKFLLGIITSNAIKFFWKKNNSDEKKTFPKIKKEAILSIPVPIINKQNKNLHDEIAKLVDQLLQLNKEKIEVKLATKAEQLQGKIDYCESRINEIVYQLYSLTEEEIKIVEAK